MATPTPKPKKPRPPAVAWPRPFVERLRDYTALAAYMGGVYGAAVAAKHGAPLLGGAVWVGGHWVLATGGFLSIRELIIQDRWERDAEGVSGLAAAIVGGSLGALRHGRRAATPAAAMGFVCGQWLLVVDATVVNANPFNAFVDR